MEVTLEGETFHARAEAWRGNQAMIERITKQLGRVDNGTKTTLWIPATACTRIRREDSIWVTTAEDHDWHDDQDQTIDYRPSLARD